jgi:hypothetical protein
MPPDIWQWVLPWEERKKERRQRQKDLEVVKEDVSSRSECCPSEIHSSDWTMR